MMNTLACLDGRLEDLDEKLKKGEITREEWRKRTDWVESEIERWFELRDDVGGEMDYEEEEE